MLLLLSLGFILQTWFVYEDSPGPVVLSGQELAGRHIWQRENCQVCHQLYGFGGFLGPDLTNAASRIERSQLDALLALGRKQMPAFSMQSAEVDAVWAFLGAMNKTGRGQARNPDSVRTPAMDVAATFSPDAAATAGEALSQEIAEFADEQVREGLRLFETRMCTACHTPFALSAVGAPDLSLSGSRLSTAEILDVLENGKMPLMPPAGVSPTERSQIAAFIVFMGEHRPDTLNRITRENRSFWVALPWWEFE